MYLTTQMKQKIPKTQKTAKPHTKKTTVLYKRPSVTNVSLEKITSNTEKAIINCFIKS